MRPNLLALLATAAASLALTAGAAAVQVPKATAPAVTVVTVGDIACAPGDPVTSSTCQQAATAKLAASLSPDHVIVLGDNQYEKGAYGGYTGSYDKSWGALKAITEAVPGNHEYYTTGAAGYYKYFADRLPASADGKGYYVTKMGSWRVFLLNSNCTKIDCAAQLSWFKTKLANASEQCIAMVMHHPRYSSGKHSNNLAVRPLWRAAYAAKVDLALAGHDHDYERFKRLDGGRVIRDDGIPSFVVGTGGKELRTIGSRKYASAYFTGKRYGVLKLTLGQGNFSYWFLGLNGTVYDTGTRSCV